MLTSDVIAFHCDGAVVCPDCHPEEADDCINAGMCGPVFAEYDEDERGATCHTCSACYGPDGWSEPHCNPRQWRWTRCPSCNSQRPYAHADADARLAALRGTLQCHCCLRPTHF